MSRKRDREIDEEIRSHLRMAIQDRMARGESADEARAAVYREFGNVALVQETTRSVWNWTGLEQLWMDFRSGVRILWKSPGLSATAAILIALVIGGNATVYSMVHALISRPAPGVHGKNLVSLGVAGRTGDPISGDFVQLAEMAAQARTVNPLIGFSAERLTLGLNDGNFAFIGASVSPRYFEVLDIPMARGRAFSEDENRLSSVGLAAIISHRVWQEQFRGAQDVIGRSVVLNGHPATIVGVTAEKFHGALLGNSEDIWVPLLSFARIRGVERALYERGGSAIGVVIIGRLHSGVSLSEAQAEFDTISKNLQAVAPDSENTRILVRRYAATVFGGMAVGGPQFLAVFSIITAITLFIVCANVANLMLARAVTHLRETAVRQALGASRLRILRMLIAEGLAVAVTAWGAACLMSYWMSRFAAWLIPSDARAPHGMRVNQANMDFSPDWRVLGYAFLLAVIATVAFTVAPAIRSWRQELLPGLKTGEQSVAQKRSGLARILVAGQLAFSVVLLTSAGLAYRALSLVHTENVRAAGNNLLLITVNPTLNIPDRETNLLLLEKLRMRLRAIPGATSVSYVRMVPPYIWGTQQVRAIGSPNPVFATTNYIGPDYLRTLGAPVLLGREFSSEDRRSINGGAVINQGLAETLWPGESAVGQTMMLGQQGQTVEVIGVCADALVIKPPSNSRPSFVLLAEQQDPAPPTAQHALRGSGETTFYIQYSGATEPVAAAIGLAMRSVDERIPLVYMRTMKQQLDNNTFALRALTLLLALFSTTSLLIAAIGQYAVIAFDMRRRSREFGIRVAMGASSRQIASSVLREGFALTAIGLTIGFALSAAAATALRAFLPGITPTDGVTYFGVFSVLATASLLACYLPARRASRVDPLQALRCE